MTQILSKRSSTADKRPDPANLANGELAINFNVDSSNVFYKNSCGGLNVVGAASVSATAPNSYSAGYSGNSPGEFWFDSTSSALKIWDGSTWFGISSGCSAGTVTSIVAGSGLTGGTITVSGTIALATSGATAGSYTNSSVTIDCFGRVTSASSGCSPVLLCTVTAKGDLIAGTSAGTVAALPIGLNGKILAANSACSTGMEWITGASGTVTSVTGTGAISVNNTDPANPVISVACGSTTTVGVVQLCNSLNSSSTTTAATAYAVGYAYAAASQALPLSGGTMSGTIAFGVGQTFPVCGIQYACTTRAGVVCLVDSVTSVCTNCFAATPASVKCAYDLANAALSKSGGTMTGNITFNGSQTFPVQDATCLQKGIVQIGSNINVSSGLISVNSGSTTQSGVLQLCDSISSTSTALAATPAAVKCSYDLANAALPKSGGTMTGQLGTQNIAIGIGYGICIGGGCIIGITDSQNTSCSTLAASAKAICMTNYEMANKLPCSGGTLTGMLSLCTAMGAGICFLGSTNPAIVDFSDSCNSTSSYVGATSKAVACTYQFAFTMLPKSGGTMTGNIVFNTGQTFPVAGIQNATDTQKGVVQTGSNIQVSSGTISVLSSSTTQSGVVQLEDSTSSTSTTLALTANQGKVLQDQIDALTNSGNTTLAGTIDASTGLMQTVTSNGASKGFVVGQVMPNASNSNKNYYTIATVAGTMTPPGGSSTQVDVGDWWLSVTNGAAHTWDLLQVGYHAPDATTTTAGVVCLATNSLTQLGVDSTTAVTPSALQSKISDSVATNSCITIASSTAAKCSYDVAIAAIPKSAFAAKGNLLAGTASGAYCALPIGTNSYVLSANSACAAGMEWIANTGGVSSLTVCPTLCNLGTSTNPILCAVPAPAPIGICPSTEYGVVKLVNDVCNNCACLAASAYAVNNAYIVASCALPKSGGTITGGVTFGCNGLGCPAYIAFSNGIANGCIYGISDVLSAGASNVAASSYALSTVYTIANAALPCSGGTLTSSVCFSAGGVCFGATTSCITGLTSALNSTSTTLALTAAGGCCLNYLVGRKLDVSGGTLTGMLIFGTGAGGVCFTDGSSYITGISDSISTTSSYTAASATAVKSAYDKGAAAIPCSAFAAKGNVLVGTASGTYSALSVGTNGQVLTACSTCASGVAWVSSGSGSGTVTSITAGTGLTGGTITTSGTIALDTTCVVQPSAYTAKGALLTATGASTPTALAVGANGLVLTANSASSTGLCWTAIPDQTPVGTVAFFAMCTAPTGWTVADGSCVSRTTYSALFAAIGTTYGAGDGSTTFQLPNLRGQFVRGWNSTASGCDANRVFGSCQTNGVGPHNHTLCAAPGSSSDANSQGWTPTSGVFATLRTTDRSALSGDTRITSAACNVAMACAGCLIGAETRPDNIALLPCIKTGNSNALGVDATPTVAGAVLGCTNNVCHNTMIGCSAGAGVLSTTCALTAVGKQALTVATGNNNTAIGTYAGCTLTTGANNTLIGFNAAPSAITVSNEITLGNSSITAIRAQVTSITSLSDARDKTRIRDIPVGLDFLNSIRPVEFEWDMRDGGKVGVTDTGFIAQDLQDVQEEIGYTLPGLVYEANPDRLEAAYGKLLPVLVKAIQELSEKNADLERRLTELEG